MIPFIILFALFALVFLIVSIYFEDLILVWLSSVIFALVGIYAISYGILDQVNWFTRGIGVLFVGIGGYTMIVASLDSIEN